MAPAWRRIQRSRDGARDRSRTDAQRLDGQLVLQAVDHHRLALHHRAVALRGYYLGIRGPEAEKERARAAGHLGELGRRGAGATDRGADARSLQLVPERL